MAVGDSYDPKRYHALQQVSNLANSDTGEFSYNFKAGDMVVAGDPGADEALADFPLAFEEVLEDT